MADEVGLVEIQQRAKSLSMSAMSKAAEEGDADTAAKWALAAKNLMDVVVSCDRAVELKTRAKLNTSRRS